ncbi:expressed protein [Cryptococcus deneoformans JEC21]|nr:expressed protein [Cryptococcus neoformans var. neoformans JEC21]AAW41059.2 expressed protein [Cryptococcus neoformans var. neoformans JEC21]
MPMLHIVGSTSTGMTYTAGVILMLRETTNWYTQALNSFFELVGKPDVKVVITDRDPALINALMSVLPKAYRFSCFWHLQENVKSNIRPCFVDEENIVMAVSNFCKAWVRYCVHAKSDEQLEEGYRKMEELYPGQKYARAISYIRGLDEIKERFVHAYINKQLHFGQTGNSRLEGQHATLKKSIDTKYGDLLLVIGSLSTYFDQQWLKILKRIELERTRCATHIPSTFVRLKGSISRAAMKLLAEQLTLAKRYLGDYDEGVDDFEESHPCSGSFTKSHGLPCAHRLISFVRERRHLEKDHIHPHWRLGSAASLKRYLDHINRLVGTPDTSVIRLDDVFDFGEDQELILDPPILSTKRGRKAPNPPVLQEDRMSAPSGRYLTQSERIMGAGLTQRKKGRCKHCQSSTHYTKDCARVQASRRVDKNQEAENAGEDRRVLVPDSDDEEGNEEDLVEVPNEPNLRPKKHSRSQYPAPSQIYPSHAVQMQHLPPEPSVPQLPPSSQFYPPLSQYYPPAPQHYPTSKYHVPPTQYIPYNQVLFHNHSEAPTPYHYPSVSGYNNLQSPQIYQYNLENNVGKDASIRSQEDSIIMQRGRDRHSWE